MSSSSHLTGKRPNCDSDASELGRRNTHAHSGHESVFTDSIDSESHKANKEEEESWLISQMHMMGISESDLDHTTPMSPLSNLPDLPDLAEEQSSNMKAQVRWAKNEYKISPNEDLTGPAQEQNWHDGEILPVRQNIVGLIN
jgi:hypothetical protein